jgi:hypothetical protein
MYRADKIIGALSLSLAQAICGFNAAGAAPLTLRWDPNPEIDIAGYYLYYGPVSGQYTHTNNVGPLNATTISDLTDGIRYYFAVSAYNILGLEGALSDEAIFDPLNPSSAQEQSFVQVQQLASPRSNFSGWVGMRLTVGDRPLLVTALGRWCVAGNTRAHRMKVVAAPGGEELPGGAITIAAGGTPEQFTYARLNGPLLLRAHASYYLVSEETLNGDSWLDLNTRVQPAAAGLVNGPVYLGSGFGWSDVERPDYSFGPVDMKFILEGTSESNTNNQPAEITSAYVTSHTSGSLRNDFTGWVGLKMTVGPQPITISELGRLYCLGNVRDHEVKVVRVRDLQDVATVSVNLASGAPGQFQYTKLGTPLVLETNQSYYVVSKELFGGDTWLDFAGTLVTAAPVARTDAAVFFGNGFLWTLAGGANQSFGPVNFKYARGSDPSLTGRVINGQFELVLDPAPGSHYVIETSTDLVTWVPVATTTLDLPSVPQPQSPTNSIQRYYRLVLLPASILP